MQKYIHGLI